MIKALVSMAFWEGRDGLRIREYDLFHLLHARSGFGDRLVELWGALTVAHLLDPEAKVAVFWDLSGNKHRGFSAQYDPSLFSVKSCDFLQTKPRGLRKRNKRFDPVLRVEKCLQHVPPGVLRLRLRSEAEWGNSIPDRIHSDLEHYGITENFTLPQVSDAYRRAATGTAPAASISKHIPSDIAQRVGFHIRRGDKLVDADSDIEMDSASWDRLEHRGLEHMKACVTSKTPMFVCSDDVGFRNEVVERIRGMGGDVLVTDIGSFREEDGFAAITDFFTLAACREIVQMTKYSTFSIAAALVGNLPLVHLVRADDPVPSRLWNWKNTIELVASDVLQKG